MLQQLIKHQPVGQIRQSIVRGEVLNPLFGVFARRNVMTYSAKSVKLAFLVFFGKNRKFGKSNAAVRPHKLIRKVPDWLAGLKDLVEYLVYQVGLFLSEETPE